MTEPARRQRSGRRAGAMLVLLAACGHSARSEKKADDRSSDNDPAPTEVGSSDAPSLNPLSWIPGSKGSDLLDPSDERTSVGEGSLSLDRSSAFFSERAECP